MATSTLAVSQIAYTGTTLTMTTPGSTDGHTITNDGRTFIQIANASGGNLTVTVTSGGTIDGRAIGDDSIVIANGATKLIGPWPVHLYNDTSGLVTVAFSTVSSVTCAAFKL